MSSDGEISVSVNAEGTEDAVGQMGSDGGAGVLGGGGGGGGGGRGGGGKGLGRLGSLLKKIAGILAFLGPILKAVGVLSKVAEAFVAPLAIVLLRLLQPVLSILIQVLPVWFDIVAFIDDIAKKVAPIILLLSPLLLLLSAAQNFDGNLADVKKDISSLLTKIKNLPGNIVESIENGTLASDIGTAILNALDIGSDGGVPDGPDDVTDNEEAAIRGAELGTDVAGALGVLPGGPAVNIALEGGLDALLNRVDRDKNKNV